MLVWNYCISKHKEQYWHCLPDIITWWRIQPAVKGFYCFNRVQLPLLWTSKLLLWEKYKTPWLRYLWRGGIKSQRQTKREGWVLWIKKWPNKAKEPEDSRWRGHLSERSRSVWFLGNGKKSLKSSHQVRENNFTADLSRPLLAGTPIILKKQDRLMISHLNYHQVCFCERATACAEAAATLQPSSPGVVRVFICHRLSNTVSLKKAKISAIVHWMGGLRGGKEQHKGQLKLPVCWAS